jgi:threonine aldolase
VLPLIDPPVQSFASDNVAGVHPAVMEALLAANAGSAAPYGADPWTRRAQDRFRELFARDVEVLFTYGGTGANVVALHAVLAPHEAVVCADGAHINVDECGAPERLTGAKLLDLPSPDGKLAPEAIAPLLHALHGEHHVQPRIVSISQPTELGTLYSREEIAALGALAREHGLLLHVDGARIANAVVATGCSVRELLVDTGVDLVSFGGTKNGLMYGEAVVFVRPELAARASFARKQAGQLASKMRFIAAQFDALLRDDVWLANAAHANAMARKLADAVGDVPGVRLSAPPVVNSVFAALPAPAIAALQEWSFFWTWDADQDLVRWMTSFAISEEDVERFAAGVRDAVLAAEPAGAHERP